MLINHEWPALKLYQGVRMEGQRKTMKMSSYLEPFPLACETDPIPVSTFMTEPSELSGMD